MKKHLHTVFTAILFFGIFASCSSSPEDVPGGQGVTLKTLVVFDNSKGICTAIVYEDYRRRDEDKIAEVPAGQRSSAKEWAEGEATFYFSYPVTLKGVDGLALNYVPSVGQDQTTALVTANATNTIPVPKLDETLSSPYAALSGDAYLFIQNNSSGTFRLYQGNSEIRPDAAASAIVNAGAKARYTITPAAASGYRLLVGANYITLPNPPVNFEAGRVYTFVYGGNVVTLSSEVEIKLENAVVTAAAGTQWNPIPLSAGVWADGSMTASTADGEVWYSFPVTSGTAYYLWWNDSKQGNATKTLDIQANGVYALSGATVFTQEDSAWETPRSFTAAANGVVKIRVTPFIAGGLGTFGIVYSTTDNTVTFNANGGAFSDENDTAKKTVPPYQPIGALPTAPVREGYTFTGWNTAQNGSGTVFTAAVTVSGSITVYAQWMVHTYTVTFNNNGGSGVNPTTKTVTYPAATIDALPTAPSRAGYTFTGWNTAVNGSDVEFTAEYIFGTAASSGTLTVFAQWAAVYTITFNNNGGSGVNPTTKTVAYPATTIDELPAEPVRTGYTFAGWSTSSSGPVNFDANTQVTANRTVYAQWAGIPYTIVYDKNSDDATGTMTDSEHTYDAAKTLTANGYTRIGYTFTGWNTQANGSGTNYAGGASVLNLRTAPGSITLYAQWVQTDITNTLQGTSVTLAMKWIPAGTFTMGSPETETGRPSGNVELQHQVTLTKGFYMGIYEVTQEQYAAVMSGNLNGLSASPSSFTINISGELTAKRPVERVSWYDTLVFCNRASIQEGLVPVYSIGGLTDPAGWGNVPTSNNATWNSVTANWNANGYRLPTEAEWEYACRAGTTTAFYTGIAEGAALQAAAWYSANSGSRTHQVGLKTPNAWGLYDMHGNVWEWCWDWYGAGYYAQSPANDPTGPACTNRVLRGGDWYVGAQNLRSAFRNNEPPSFRHIHIGFRLVRSP